MGLFDADDLEEYHCDLAYNKGYEASYAAAQAKQLHRHGKWIRRKTATHHGELYCSICEEESPIQMLWRYCPNCGARMDSNTKESYNE